jgi:hypothetical protein
MSHNNILYDVNGQDHGQSGGNLGDYRRKSMSHNVSNVLYQAMGGYPTSTISAPTLASAMQIL